MQAMCRRLEGVAGTSERAPRTTANQTPVGRVCAGVYFGPRAPFFGLDNNDSLLLSLILDVPYSVKNVNTPVQVGNGG